MLECFSAAHFDFRGPDGLELIGIRILVSEVAKDISASPPSLLPAFRFSSRHLLQSLQTVLDQIDFTFRRLDALRRLLLERMDNPDILAKLHHIDHAKRQGNLEQPPRQNLRKAAPSSRKASKIRLIILNGLEARDHYYFKAVGARQL